MAAALGTLMLACVLRIVMAAGRAGRNRLVVGGRRLARPVLVDMKAVRTGRQSFERGLDRGAAGAIGDRHSTERVAGPGWGCLLDLCAQLRRQHRRGTEAADQRQRTQLPYPHRVLLRGFRQTVAAAWHASNLR